MKKTGLLALPFLLLPCASFAEQIILPGADEGASVEGMLSENPLQDNEAIRSALLYKDEGASVHLVQIRTSERLHMHKEHDLIVVLQKGKGVLHLDGKAFEMREGDSAFIKKGAPHRFENTSPGVAAGIGIFVPPFDGKDIVPVTDLKK